MIDFSPFVNNHLNSYQLSEFDFEKKAMLAAIENEIKDSFNSLNQEKTKQKRFDLFKIEHTLPEDYQEYITTIHKNIQIIFGIRHLGLDPNMPFIEFQATTHLSTKEILDIYHKYLAPKFIKFQPKSIRFYHNENLNNTITGSVYLVQTAERMKTTPAFDQEASITLTTPKDDSYFDWYATGYKDFHNRFPDLKPYVSVSTKDDLEQSRKEDLLRIVKIDKQPIGLISAMRDQFLGQDSIYFLEIFIENAYTGKGLAKCIQRKFVAEVAKQEIIWGTIDYKNNPSLKTALSTGRKPVRYEHFIEI